MVYSLLQSSIITKFLGLRPRQPAEMIGDKEDRLRRYIDLVINMEGLLYFLPEA